MTDIVPARKAEGAAGFESTLEGDCSTLLDFSPDVSGFAVQPVTPTWHDGARDHRHTPHRRAALENLLHRFGPELIRVSPGHQTRQLQMPPFLEGGTWVQTRLRHCRENLYPGL